MVVAGTRCVKMTHILITNRHHRLIIDGISIRIAVISNEDGYDETFMYVSGIDPAHVTVSEPERMQGFGQFAQQEEEKETEENV